MKSCQKCGQEWTRRESPGFKEACPGCTSYLHSCLNCKFYNPTADRCSSVTAECTGDRASLNYCEEYQFRDTPNHAGRRASNGRAANGSMTRTPGLGDLAGRENSAEKPPSVARDKFDKLFGA